MGPDEAKKMVTDLGFARCLHDGIDWLAGKHSEKKERLRKELRRLERRGSVEW